jgi:hypothetical protein
MTKDWSIVTWLIYEDARGFRVVAPRKEAVPGKPGQTRPRDLRSEELSKGEKLVGRVTGLSRKTVLNLYASGLSIAEINEREGASRARAEKVWQRPEHTAVPVPKIRAEAR